MNILKETTDFGEKKITVKGNPGLRRGDNYNGKTVESKHTYKECERCGDGNIKTLITLQ